MSREQEFQHVKKLIKENYKYARHGIFDTRGILNDGIRELYKGQYFRILISFGYEYFEVFGTDFNEFDELQEFYESLG